MMFAHAVENRGRRCECNNTVVGVLKRTRRHGILILCRFVYNKGEIYSIKELVEAV
jgi:hypothetical protein